MKRTTFLGVVLVVVTILFFIYVTTKEAEASPTVNEEHEVRGVFMSYIDLENHKTYYERNFKTCRCNEKIDDQCIRISYCNKKTISVFNIRYV